MNKRECLDFFRIQDLIELPKAIWSLLELPLEHRNDRFKDLLRLNNYQLCKDWFQPIFEEELSERKQKKQDFTPYELSVLCSLLTSRTGRMHEPTAGNGSMVIADWRNRLSKCTPWEYHPSENMVTVWELSDRSLPILLLNLSIRGIMGYVYHGDVLEQTVKQKYILLNRGDDALGFSEIHKVGINEYIKKINYDIQRR